MRDRDSDEFPTVAVVLLLVLLAAVLLGGLAMVGMMGSSWHRDAVGNGTWHDGGMMGGDHDMGLGWGMVAIGLGVVFVIAILWLLWPGRESRQQVPPYQQPIAPQPYPMQPPPRPPAPQMPPRADAAMDILEGRLARGEISEKEYLSTLETLKRGRAG